MTIRKTSIRLTAALLCIARAICALPSVALAVPVPATLDFTNFDPGNPGTGFSLNGTGSYTGDGPLTIQGGGGYSVFVQSH